MEKTSCTGKTISKKSNPVKITVQAKTISLKEPAKPTMAKKATKKTK